MTANPSPDAKPTLRATLEAAAEGLLYTSESDRPFEWFALPGGEAGWPYGAEEFFRRLGVHADSPEERSLEHFFARHIESTDPHDTGTQRIRPRYEALRETLRSELREVRTFREGRIEINCYVVGGDGRGSLCGFRTTAIET